MSTSRLAIAPFLALTPEALLLDVRSPAEFEQGHIPGAVNLCLFTDEERKVVGTAYKQQSRETAIKIGLDYFGPKMRSMVEQVENLSGAPEGRASDRMVLLYCWRGGMRSGAVAWLLQLYGFKVHVLSGGYKAFRNHVLQTFERPFSFKVLGGYTGSGKTEVLQALKEKGEPVIDLEGLACHKGSAFGNINMPDQPTQEMFENYLAMQLQQLDQGEVALAAGGSGEKACNGYAKPYIWVEDESQRIGHINLPPALWQTLRQSPVVFMDIPFEERLRHIVAEYGPLDRQRLADAITRITKRLGGQHAKAALEHLREGNIRDCFAILLSYYDKHYVKALYNRDNAEALLTRVPLPSVTAANADQLSSLTVQCTAQG